MIACYLRQDACFLWRIMLVKAGWKVLVNKMSWLTQWNPNDMIVNESTAIIEVIEFDYWFWYWFKTKSSWTKHHSSKKDQNSSADRGHPPTIQQSNYLPIQLADAKYRIQCSCSPGEVLLLAGVSTFPGTQAGWLGVQEMQGNQDWIRLRPPINGMEFRCSLHLRHNWRIPGKGPWTLKSNELNVQIQFSV